MLLEALNPYVWKTIFHQNSEMLERQFGIHLHTHESLLWTSEMSSIRNASPLEPFTNPETISYD